MIKPVKLLGILYSHHILNVLHHTNNGGIPAGITAYRTDFGIAHIMTYTTILHLTLELRDGTHKLFYRLVALAQGMKNKAQSCLRPIPGSLANSLTAFSKSADGYFCIITDKHQYQHADLLLRSLNDS